MPKTKKFIAVSGIVAAVLVGGGVATAVAMANSQPDQNTVAKYLPDNSEALLTAALDPSAEQKLKMVELSQHLPADVKGQKASEVRDKVLGQIFTDDKINFNTDIKPWLGDEAAAAVLPPQDGSNTPVGVGIVQTKDEKATTALLNKQKVDPATYRFMKGYLFLAESAQADDSGAKPSTASSQKTLDAIAQVVNGKAKSLQDNTRYKANIASLHGEHIVLGWVDVPTLVRQGIAAAKAQQDNMKQSADSSTNFSIGDGSSSSDYSSSNTSFSRTAFGGPTAPTVTSPVYRSPQTVASPVNPSPKSVTPSSIPSDDPFANDPNFSTDYPSGGSDSGSSNPALGIQQTLLNESGLFDSQAATDTLNKLQAAADASGTNSFELYVTGNGLTFQSVSEHSKPGGSTSDRALLKGLPADTMAAFDAADFGTTVKKAFDQYATGKDAPLADVDSNNPEIRKLISVLGNEAVGVVSGGTDPSFGFVSQVTDVNQAADAIKGLASRYPETVKLTNTTLVGGKGFKLTSTDATATDTALFIDVANSRMSISNSSTEANALVGGTGNLGASQEVAAAFGDVNKLTVGSLYLNLQSIVKWGQSGDSPIKDPQAVAWLNTLNVAGFQSYSQDGHDYAEFRLTFK